MISLFHVKLCLNNSCLVLKYILFIFSRLVAGDVDGHFKELYSKVQKVLSSHGKFSFLLVAGNFFGDSGADWLPYKNGSKPGWYSFLAV